MKECLFILRSSFFILHSSLFTLHSLHPAVTNPEFLFPLYFIRGGYLVTGTFSHIYAMPEGWNTENGKGVCTRVASRVHTVGGVSSDTLL